MYSYVDKAHHQGTFSVQTLYMEANCMNFPICKYYSIFIITVINIWFDIQYMVTNRGLKILLIANLSL
jgi:hypothetical protein